MVLVLLSGTTSIDVNSLKRFKEKGGTLLVQDEKHCMVPNPLKPVYESAMSDYEGPVQKLVAHILSLKEKVSS